MGRGQCAHRREVLADQIAAEADEESHRHLNVGKLSSLAHIARLTRSLAYITITAVNGVRPCGRERVLSAGKRGSCGSVPLVLLGLPGVQACCFPVSVNDDPVDEQELRLKREKSMATHDIIPVQEPAFAPCTRIACIMNCIGTRAPEPSMLLPWKLGSPYWYK